MPSYLQCQFSIFQFHFVLLFGDIFRGIRVKSTWSKHERAINKVTISLLATSNFSFRNTYMRVLCSSDNSIEHTIQISLLYTYVNRCLYTKTLTYLNINWIFFLSKRHIWKAKSRNHKIVYVFFQKHRVHSIWAKT